MSMPLTKCSEQQHCTLGNSFCGKSNIFNAVYEGLPKRDPLKLRPQLNNLICTTLERSEEWSNKKEACTWLEGAAGAVRGAEESLEGVPLTPGCSNSSLLLRPHAGTAGASAGT